jgi:hypothetical protein
MKSKQPFNSMLKPKKKYGMVQISVEAHQMLREYCDHHGFKYSSFVSAIIKQHIKGK